MSHLISLCSQKCSSGGLNRVVQWLNGECKCEESVTTQSLEVRLALNIARAGGIGCTSGDELDVIVALSSFSEWFEQHSHQRRIKEIQARALGCTACLLRWGRELAFCDSPTIADKQFSVSRDCSTIEEKMGLTAEQSVDLLSKAADMGDSSAMFNLSLFHFSNNDNEEDTKKAVELLQRASDNGWSSAMVNLAVCFWKGVFVVQD